MSSLIRDKILDLMVTDDVIVKDSRIEHQWDSMSDSEKKQLNEFLITLCGFSYTSIIEQIKENEK